MTLKQHPPERPPVEPRDDHPPTEPPEGAVPSQTDDHEGATETQVGDRTGPGAGHNIDSAGDT